MKQVIEKINIYKFNELSNTAKENAKKQYLRLERDEKNFYLQCMEKVDKLFPNSNLELQYSLSSSQGDGVNIYDDLDLDNLLNCIKDKFNNKEYKTLKFYLDNYDSYYNLDYNNRYTYCKVKDAEIGNDLTYTMIYNLNFRNVNKQLIKKFDKLGKEFIKNLCDEFIKDGYKYFYEVSDDEIINADFWYTENGDFYAYELEEEA